MIASMDIHVGQSPTQLLVFAVLPIAKVLVMCSFGLLMASSYVNLLTLDNRRLLTKLVFTIFLPCLIFTQLGSAVTFCKMLEWWFIPVNVLVGAFGGCAIGYAVAYLFKPPPEFFNLTVVMIGIGNIGNIPLVLIGSICEEKDNPFGASEVCNERGVAYISFGQWVGAIIVYTYAYKMLAPPDMPSVAPTEYESHDEKNEDAVTENDSDDNASFEVSLIPKTDTQQGVLIRITRALRAVRYHDVLQPPVVASLLAIAAGAIRPLKGLLFEQDAPLYFITDSLNMMGGAMIPCIMLALGGNLIQGPGSSSLGWRTTVIITVVRLILVPPFGLLIVYLADRLGFLPPGDTIFRFVLLLQHSMPSSILAGAVASLQGYAEKEVAAVLFWEHICAIVTMAGWLALYMRYLF